MKRSWLPIIFGAVISALILFTFLYSRNFTQNNTESQNIKINTSESPLPSGESPSSSPSPELNSTNSQPDLTIDGNGLSKATVILKTNEGIIKFKFYTQDAPKTAARMVELINQGFYNGLSFHRVVPGFVIQGGDPQGNGTGGSGQKLPAEFNNRHHIEGAVAMARTEGDPNSADSQFYISLGVHPHLDHNYTVFGQVIEGMDIAKQIKVGDKIIQAILQ
jgi:cyclophilin family peptidyl-prolyl cis-trans isomerase